MNKKCADRTGLLEDAYKMAKEYSDKLGPIEKWLGGAEKKVKEMETVPTEEDQIQTRIKEHDKLHQEILGKQPTFDDLADVATILMPNLDAGISTCRLYDKYGCLKAGRLNCITNLP